MTLDRLTGNFRVDLDQRAGRPVNVVEVVVGPTGFVGAPEQAIVDYIRSTFADRPKPDLIVTFAGPAAVFARKYRQKLFPEVPLLLGAVDQRYLGDAPLGENETAVAVAGDSPGFVEQILQLLPQTRQVFMIMGSGQLGAFWHREFGTQFKRFQDRLTFIWSDTLSLPEILRQCARLPTHSAIFYFAFGTDAQGGAYADERVLADLYAVANAPIFGVQSVMLGTGIVGGPLVAIDGLSRSTADAAIRILDGVPPAQCQNTATTAGSTDLRLARAPALGHPGEPVAARERRALSRSESVARVSGRGAERGGRAGPSIAPDRRAPVPTPRTATRRDRQPAQPHARRRCQPPSDDVGADQFDCPRAQSAAQLDDAQCPGVADDGHHQSCDSGHDWRGAIRYRDPGRARHADHRPPSHDAQKPSARQETDRYSCRDQGEPGSGRPRHESAPNRHGR